ncbi:uncharacterized protein LOC143879083 [Tasmannia lanceolata]|uniref:uncharacterized protein LOC143879083 n=1 Tax=Tasmannia lanceolata TaxID=3420 RepID=UPI0040631BAC
MATFMKRCIWSNLQDMLFRGRCPPLSVASRNLLWIETVSTSMVVTQGNTETEDLLTKRIFYKGLGTSQIFSWDRDGILLSWLVSITEEFQKKGDPLDRSDRYRRLVGKLIYLTVTRPDISYAVGVVSQYMSSPHTSHWSAVIQVLKYLKSAPGKGLLFKRHGHMQIEGLSDADCARSPTDKRSTTGHYTFLGVILSNDDDQKKKKKKTSSNPYYSKSLNLEISSTIFSRNSCRVLQNLPSSTLDFSEKHPVRRYPVPIFVFYLLKYPGGPVQNPPPFLCRLEHACRSSDFVCTTCLPFLVETLLLLHVIQIPLASFFPPKREAKAEKPWLFFQTLKEKACFVLKFFARNFQLHWQTNNLVTREAMREDGERTCPLCTEEMDLTHQQLKPCKCSYEVWISIPLSLYVTGTAFKNLQKTFGDSLGLAGWKGCCSKQRDHGLMWKKETHPEDTPLDQIYGRSRWMEVSEIYVPRKCTSMQLFVMSS